MHGMPIPENRVLFKPAGIPMPSLEIVRLNMDEFEAMRLVDFEGKSPGEAATLMNVSQPTISRILNQGRAKVSDVLVNGKALRIEGGTFKFAFKGFACRKCKNQWPSDDLVTAGTCPSCDSDEVYALKKEP